MLKTEIKRVKLEAYSVNGNGNENESNKEDSESQTMTPLTARSALSLRRTSEAAESAYYEAIKQHPFYHNAHSVVDVYSSSVIRDGAGQVVAVLIKNGLPRFAAEQAASVLRPAATRTSLRSRIYGGEAPHSGIAGYFDYRGSPIEHKYRKTAFTYEHIEKWPEVYPMIDYVSSLYKLTLPSCWQAQSDAIPDVVRIHNSPFSTLTINSRFRTASHTDAGDFDNGFGCLACLEGEFAGLCLTIDRLQVNVRVRPCDVLIFNTHHWHSNTELECDNVYSNSSMNNTAWSRLTCVFYYRAALGEPAAYAEYTRRLENALQAPHLTPTLRFTSIKVKPNGENLNKPATLYEVSLTPFLVYSSLRCASKPVNVKRDDNNNEEIVNTSGRELALRMHHWLLQDRTENYNVKDNLFTLTVSRAVQLFGELLEICDGIPERNEEALVMATSAAILKTPAMGGFKECDAELQEAIAQQTLLEVHYLSQCIGEELLEVWRVAREKWLHLVQEAWNHLHSRAPNRTDFVWNNKSEMNAAFFDLCEVGKQVMLSLLAKESATPQEEQAFWTIYATHLHKACECELHMPTDAMSMRKLNVKIKDYQFGGTRYFKDLPPEEQQRRLERKARIEEARRHGENTSTNINDLRSHAWLHNDTFDYQTEECDVDYIAHGWILPEENALQRTELTIKQEACDMKEETTSHSVFIKKEAELEDEEEEKQEEGEEENGAKNHCTTSQMPVHILVVLPRPSMETYTKPARGKKRKCVKKTPKINNKKCNNINNDEWNRLMCNPAALRIQKGKPLYEQFQPFITNDSNNNKDENKPRNNNNKNTVPTRKVHKDIKQELLEEEEYIHCRAEKTADFVTDNECKEKTENDVCIDYMYFDEDWIKEDICWTHTYQFIIVQYVLCTIADDEWASKIISWFVNRAQVCVMIAETDVQCRYYYSLTQSTRNAYDAVAESCYRALLKSYYGIYSTSEGENEDEDEVDENDDEMSANKKSTVVLRSKNELEQLAEHRCCARYKFKGSPLNTMLMIIDAREEVYM